MDLTGFAAAICEDLDITCPQIEQIERLNTDTQFGAYAPGTNTIFIRRDAGKLDKAFALAHELRHIWQIKQGWAVIGKPDSAQIPVTDYNLQAAEIDANAYAMLVMRELFIVTPLFSGLSEEVVDKIRMRAAAIGSERKGKNGEN